MSQRSFLLSDALDDYVRAHTEPPDDVLRDLMAETQGLPGAVMQISPDIGALLTLLTRLVGTTAAVEVGTYTGYSSICIARGLEPGGRLICFDISEEPTAVARRYWARAGVEDRVELRIGPALDGLRALPPGAGLDLAFIDADKESYPAYLAELVPRVRTGGLIVADNVLQRGRVVDPSDDSPAVAAIRRFNADAAADDRLDALLLAVGDGMSILRKRPNP